MGGGDVVLFFFFFKQKTAYEIYQCDWSSDVCSSDLVDETELPLQDCSVDRILLVHAIEASEYQRDMLREAWRVLTSGGRLMVVAPNRRGIWARFERTPLGWGHPYSKAQLSRLLRDNMFTPTRSARALFMPPLRSRTLLRSAPAWERIGRRWFPTFFGVVLLAPAR